MNRLLAFCGVFVAGIGIGCAISWLFLDSGTAASLPGDVRPAAIGGGSAAREAAAPAAAERSGDARAAATIRTKSLEEASRGTIGEAGMAAPVGSGKIAGRVKTEKGEGVAGVVVRATFSGERDERVPRWKSGDGVPVDDDVQTHVNRAIEDFERGHAMRRDATTNENGEFTIDGLLDDRYGMHAYLKGFRVTPDRRDLEWSARPGMTIDFVAAPVIVLPLDVRMPDGTAPKKAKIAIRVGNTSTGDQWSHKNTDLRLSAGTYAISAEAGDHEDYRSDTKTVTLEDGKAPEAIQLALKARTGIRGRIKVPAGYSFDWLQAFALRHAGSAVPDENALKRGLQASASSWNGYEFKFEDLAAGTYQVGVGTWETTFATKTVEVAANAIVETVIEITDAGDNGLVVRVVDAAGQSIADVNLDIETSDNHDGAELVSVRPKKDGAWVVVPKKTGAEIKDHWITAQSQRLGTKSTALPASLSGELKIEMKEPATLEVTLTGYAGSGHEGKIRVHARPLTAGREKGGVVHYYGNQGNEGPGPDGKQTISALQPGRYRVEVQYQRERWGGAAVERTEIDVAPGPNAVSIAVPPLYTLAINAGAAAADSNINLQMMGTAPSDMRWHSSKVGADGIGTFEGLVAGKYRVTIHAKAAKRGKSMTITVPAAGVVSFAEQVETAIAIKSLDAEGYLASIGIQANDVISGVDGTLFDGSVPASQVFFGLVRAKKAIRLSILRGGKSIEVAADSEKLLDAANNGQNFEPVSR